MQLQALMEGKHHEECYHKENNLKWTQTATVSEDSQILRSPVK